MTKKFFLVAIMIMALFLTLGTVQSASAVQRTTSYNHWLYANVNLGLTPEWSLHVMPGHSYQYKLENPNTPGKDDAVGTFLTEFFIGPWYSMKLTDALSLKVGVEYYFMGFSGSKDDDAIDWYNHCIEVTPVLAYKVNDQISLSSRTIFHNVLFTSDKKSVDNDESVDGYGMLIRELITFSYSVNSLITASLGNEIFYGCVEKDGLTTTSKYSKGYNENRIIPGLTFKNLAPGLSITANYIYRTIFNTDDNKPKANFDKNEVYDQKHYIQVLLNYNFNLY